MTSRNEAEVEGAVMEALRGALEWDKARGYRMPYRVRDPIYAALDALSTPTVEAGEGQGPSDLKGSDTQPGADGAVAVLPEWNDLTNEQRAAIVAVADYNVGGTDAECYAGQVSLEIYNHVRENIRLALPPLIAPFHAAATTDQRGGDEGFQSRVLPWLIECFGAEIAGDRQERCDRFIEEALELAQSLDWTADRAHALVDYVFGRPKGEPHQEVGGVMVTLAALCQAVGLDMQAGGDDELARIMRPEIVQKIRAKQAAKPTGSALPIATTERPGERGGYFPQEKEPNKQPAPAPVGWRPIETAPTDSTKFDAWCVPPESPEMGVRFTDVQMRGDGSGFGYVVHTAKGVVWQYLDARDEGAGFPAWIPTHWMPLPPAPDTAPHTDGEA